MVRYGVIWCGVVWYVVVLYGMVWCCMVWYGMVWSLVMYSAVIIQIFTSLTLQVVLATYGIPAMEKLNV